MKVADGWWLGGIQHLQWKGRTRRRFVIVGWHLSTGINWLYNYLCCPHAMVSYHPSAGSYREHPAIHASYIYFFQTSYGVWRVRSCFGKGLISKGFAVLCVREGNLKTHNPQESPGWESPWLALEKHHCIENVCSVVPGNYWPWSSLWS